MEANLGDDGLRLFGFPTPPSLNCVVPESEQNREFLELVGLLVHLAM